MKVLWGLHAARGPDVAQACLTLQTESQPDQKSNAVVNEERPVRHPRRDEIHFVVEKVRDFESLCVTIVKICEIHICSIS
jgi:hypothetical protein